MATNPAELLRAWLRQWDWQEGARLHPKARRLVTTDAAS